ncbi:MAG: diguanylate cyclase [Lachnospiraceae bacterium]|nr:diguanylate cyclase [Lachnospiraceae bacterium]
MTGFTHKTPGYEEFPAYLAFKNFFDNFLLERDYEKTLSCVEDDFFSLGPDEDEVITNKDDFLRLLRAELDAISEPIEYIVKSIYGKEITENIWNILAVLEILLPNDRDKKISYTARFTGCFKLSEKGFVVISTHMSEPGSIRNEKEFLPLKYADNNGKINRAKTEQIIFDIMCKSMPGGIVSGYATDGFPLYFVNNQYLELLGYSSYEEYYEAANGLGISHIHPDDVELVHKETMHSYSTDTQYGVEYRIRHKDGHYIHVYDIGKKMITPDHKEVIICVLYDMTEDAKLKELLIQESTHDALTDVYNRGAGIHTIEQALKQGTAYSFAFFDIDNLKQLNDIYDHKAGDHALKHFAKLLKTHLGDQTVLARFGGDEFVAFFKDTLEKSLIHSKFSELELEYCSFIENQYPKSHSSVSIGCVTGTKKCTFNELCQIADELMYDIKKNGKKGYKIVELN